MAVHRGVEAALFRPVRTRNAFEETVERLLQAIRLGVAAPGEKLPAERDLAARLGVSRVTLREAIRAVAEAGYVESRRGRYGGTFVAMELPSQAARGHGVPAVELEDVLTLRRILEVGAAEAAAARTLSPDERQHLRVRLTEIGPDAVADPAEYRRRDSRLHLAIAEAAGSPSLVPLVAENRMRLNGLLDQIPLLPRNIAHSDEQHEAIVVAILAGDGERAAEAMRAHVAGSAALLHGFLD